MWKVGGMYGCGWWEWVQSMGVVSRRWVWVEFMGVASGCGCKVVYRFVLILLILTPFVSALFAASLLFVHFKKIFSFLLRYFFVIM